MMMKKMTIMAKILVMILIKMKTIIIKVLMIMRMMAMMIMFITIIIIIVSPNHLDAHCTGIDDDCNGDYEFNEDDDGDDDYGENDDNALHAHHHFHKSQYCSSHARQANGGHLV